MALSEETTQKLITIAENIQKVYNNGVADGQRTSGGTPTTQAVIYLTNDIRIESRENGLWIVDGENETLLYDNDRCITTVNRANYAESAERASEDGDGRPIKGIDVQEYGDNSYSYVVLYDGQVALYGIVDGSLESEIPDGISIGYTSTLFFTTPSSVDEYYFSTSQSVYFKGDNTNNGTFEPEADTRYTIKFEYDGVNIVGYVSGVPVM